MLGFGIKCAICNKKLMFTKMKFDGGYVCKTCYSIVSKNFTETIIKKKYDDVMEIYNSHKENQYDIGEFEITSRIANLILFDDNHKLICLPNNRIFSPQSVAPKIFGYSEMVSCELWENQKKCTDDSLLINKIDEDKDKFINNLQINISLTNDDSSFVSINILSTPVRKSSFAYSKSVELAQRIMKKLNEIVS